jgi:hypothetical protein
MVFADAMAQFITAFCGSPCCWAIFVIILLSLAYNSGVDDGRNNKNRW